MRRFFWRPIHVSWRITVFCIFFVIGVIIARFWSFENGYLFIILGGALFLVGITLPFRWVFIVMAISGVVLGVVRGSYLMAPLVYFQENFNSYVEIVGVVADDPELSKDGRMRFKIDTKKLNTQSVQGLVWVELAKTVNTRRGDELTITGVLQEGFGNFSAMIKKGIVKSAVRPTPGDIPLTVRDWFASKIRLSITEPQASLGIGYLVGQKSALPGDLYTAMQIAGLTHVIVASGYNLTILVRFARRLFQKVSKFTSTAVAIMMITSFVAVTGISPSMSRAGLVALLSLMAWYYGRKFHPVVLIIFVAAVTVAWNPSYVWGDIGWMLSFSSFVGVIILAPLLHRYLFGDKEPGAIRQVLGETFSAQLITLPVILLAFGKLSTVSLVANLLILPFIPLAMLLTFIGGLSAIFMPSVAPIVGLPANWLLGYMIEVAMRLAEPDWAQIDLVLSVSGVLAVVTGLSLLIIYLSRRTAYDLRESNIIV